MVEVFEYALVVLVSSILAAFSFGVYSGLGSSIGPATDEATFASVVALARAAIEHGSSNSTLAFDHAMISCGSGVITFTTGRYSGNASLPADCSFPPQEVGGIRDVIFEYSGGLLALQVR